MKAEVSALMDDALEDSSQSSVLNALCRDGQMRQTWSEYHLIGDALRRSPRLSMDVAAQVMARLAEEPTVLAPQAAPRRRSGALRYALPLAASVMGVGAVAWVAQTLNAPEAVQLATLQPGTAVVAATRSTSETPLLAAQTSPPAQLPAQVPVQVPAQAPTQVLAAGAAPEQAELSKPGDVKPYLFAHQGYSPVTRIQGVAHYVRIVSDTREGAAR